MGNHEYPGIQLSPLERLHDHPCDSRDCLGVLRRKRQEHDVHPESVAGRNVMEDIPDLPQAPTKLIRIQLWAVARGERVPEDHAESRDAGFRGDDGGGEIVGSGPGLIPTR
jgi:hypothetical protein